MQGAGADVMSRLLAWPPTLEFESWLLFSVGVLFAFFAVRIVIGPFASSADPVPFWSR